MRDWAQSGVPFLTGRAGGPPIIPPGNAATVARALSRQIADMTSGVVSIDRAQLLSERSAFTGHRRSGDVSLGGACRLLPTSDGWAAVSCARPDDPSLLGALVGSDVGADPWPAVTRWLAEHSGAELAERAELLGIAAGPVATPSYVVPAPATPRFSPGALVVDFSALWAGPLCAHILGLAGADVIKVETPDRPDGARRGNPDFYHLLHTGHQSVVLDPRTADGRRSMARLVDAADIVIEASRPRALKGFGLDPIRSVRNGTTWISITAHGRASARIGFGDDVAASAGLVAVDDVGPMFVGDAIADPLTGLTAAALALTGPDDERGALWDVSMSGVVAATLTGASAPLPYQSVDGWQVDCADGPAVLTPPTRREPAAAAAESGADTADVVARYGLA